MKPKERIGENTIATEKPRAFEKKECPGIKKENEKMRKGKDEKPDGSVGREEKGNLKENK